MAYLVYFKYKNLDYEIAVRTDDIAESIVKLSNTLFSNFKPYSVCMQDGTIGTYDGKIYFKYRKIDNIFSF